MKEPEVETLYVSDEQLRQALGVGEKALRVAIKQLERNGFPKRQPLFANKRYWPAVKAFLDRRNGLSITAPPIEDGQEKVYGSTKDQQRSRHRLAPTR